MKKIFFFLPILFMVFIACNDKGNGSNPFDNTNTKRNKDDNNRYKDDNKDEFPNNRDEGMDRDYEDDMSDSKGSITGRWRMMDPQLEGGDEPTEEELKNIRSSTIEFNRDGSYIAITREDGVRKKEYGTYTYDARSKTLETVEDENGQRESFEVVFRGKNKVILTFSEGTATMERD